MLQLNLKVTDILIRRVRSDVSRVAAGVIEAPSEVRVEAGGCLGRGRGGVVGGVAGGGGVCGGVGYGEGDAGVGGGGGPASGEVRDEEGGWEDGRAGYEGTEGKEGGGEEGLHGERTGDRLGSLIDRKI